MRVAIVGAGYVGLVTGACLAESGHRVTLIDTDETKVRAIEAGDAPFYEPGLAELLGLLPRDALRATTDLRAAVVASEVTLIATGTPFDGTRIDLSYVEQAAQAIGAALAEAHEYHVVAVKSTVVPGTTDTVVLPILQAASGKRAGRDFGVGMTPEFLSEGTALADYRRPDRIVLGGIDERTHAVLDELHRSFGGVPRIRTQNATAELIKYASNALLATAISFANEIANLCATVPRADAMEVMRGVHAMRELSHGGGEGHAVAGLASFLSPGCGFGGSCLPKDVKALSAWALSRGQSTPLLDAALRVNAERPARVLGLLERSLGSLEGRRIAVLGLAFKPGTDDVRESPAFPLVRLLLARGAEVRAFDPIARETAARALAERADVIAPSLADAIDGAAAVVLMTRWSHFEAVPDLLRSVTPSPLLVDARRMIEPRAYERYTAIGLGPRAKTRPSARYESALDSRRRARASRALLPTPTLGRAKEDAG